MQQIGPALGVVAASVLAITGASATAQTVATTPDVEVPVECALSRPARSIGSIREVPGLAEEFARAGIDIADNGEPFIPYDVEDAASRGLPHRQFLRAYEFRDRIVVWYYHGGFGTHVHVAELMRRRDTREADPVLRFTGRRLAGPLCQATQALLDGIVGLEDW